MSSSQMIDWDLAVSTGARLVRPGPQVGREEARQTVSDLRSLSWEAVRHVREFTGLDGSSPQQPAAIVDRPGWIRANVDGFRVVLEPLMSRLADRRSSVPGGQLVTMVGARVSGMQVGAILAYMAGRVLGQYELFLPPDPSGYAPTGRMTLVAPNIVHVERELGVDSRDFRLWVCLHEETHRAQFTTVPWLRPYVQEQMTEFLLASDLDPGAILERLRAGADAVVDAVRGGDSNLVDAVQTPEQREILDRLTSVMTLVEGHGDYVMDGVGPDVVPSVAEIREKFQRRREGGNRLDQTLRRVLGIEMKMKQYAQGSAFARTVISRAGMSGFNRVWEMPDNLPTREEIEHPDIWIARVLGGSDGPAGADGSGAGEDGPAR